MSDPQPENPKAESLQGLADLLLRREPPEDVEILKQNRIRTVVRRADVVLKVLHQRPRKARREARTLERARGLEIPVPDLVGSGPGWIATRFVEGRPATRDDLDALLPAIREMHARGMLHRDLHLGNVRIGKQGPIFLDTQKAIFAPTLPAWIRDPELGYFAYSLGEPLPDALATVRRFRDRRAQSHWRSRTKRCLTESSGFTAFEFQGHRGYRRRDVSADALRAALGGYSAGVPFKETRRTALYQTHGWIVKRHARSRAARGAWIGGVGLETRGIGVARPLAWAGPWLVMEDAGKTLIDWVDFERSESDPAGDDALAEAAAELLSELHRVRAYHPDLKANNVCWEPGRAPRLIDYGRVRFGRPLSRRRRIKNLAQLNAALPDSLPREPRERALALYVDRMRESERLPELQQKVVALSLKRAHRWSGC